MLNSRSKYQYDIIIEKAKSLVYIEGTDCIFNPSPSLSQLEVAQNLKKEIRNQRHFKRLQISEKFKQPKLLGIIIYFINNFHKNLICLKKFLLLKGLKNGNTKKRENSVTLRETPGYAG